MPRPHCPECKTTSKPHSKITGLKGHRVLLVYCSECGSIFGAVNAIESAGGAGRSEGGSFEAHETGAESGA
jgi:hypothetical protein